MARMPNARVLAEVLRSGNLRARLRAARDGLIGVRLQLVAAAVDLGLLDSLGGGPVGTEQLAGRPRVVDQDLPRPEAVHQRPRSVHLRPRRPGVSATAQQHLQADLRCFGARSLRHVAGFAPHPRQASTAARTGPAVWACPFVGIGLSQSVGPCEASPATSSAPRPPCDGVRASAVDR